MFYEFEPGHKAVEAIKDIFRAEGKGAVKDVCSVEGEGAVDDGTETRRIQNFTLVARNSAVRQIYLGKKALIPRLCSGPN